MLQSIELFMPGQCCTVLYTPFCLLANFLLDCNGCCRVYCVTLHRWSHLAVCLLISASVCCVLSSPAARPSEFFCSVFCVGPSPLTLSIWGWTMPGAFVLVYNFCQTEKTTDASAQYITVKDIRQMQSPAFECCKAYIIIFLRSFEY